MTSVLTNNNWLGRLKNSIESNKHCSASNYFQIASVDAKNKPRNRTVVFRGFEGNSDNIFIITDTRSDKFSEWQVKPNAEICWYFVETREQYRIQVDVDLIAPEGEDASAQAKILLSGVWNALSEASKKQFYWPEPKKFFNEDDSLADVIDTERHLVLPNNFCVVRLRPNAVDYLNLYTAPHSRILSSLQNSSPQNSLLQTSTSKIINNKDDHLFSNTNNNSNLAWQDTKVNP